MGQWTFAESRDRLRRTLSALTEVASGRGSGAVAEAATALIRKLEEERFNVVVAGEFKRGKSTLVNALLGMDVLPTSVVPLTSVVTAVTWGDPPRAEVFLRTGETRRVGVGEIAAFVTERGNPNNALGVDRAIVYCPSDLLRDGVFLVDTPGVGSVHRHNTEAALAFVPEADAAIFLTSADPPISDGERRFLEAVSAEAARMFFVLNKIDYLGGDELSDALSFTAEVVGSAVGRPARLYPVSARRALRAKLDEDEATLDASGLPEFERDFRRFLMREKGRTILASAAGQALKLLVDERNSLHVEERTLALSDDEVSERTRAMEAVFEEALRAREDIRALLRAEQAKLIALVDGDLSDLRRRETRSLLVKAEALLADTEDLHAAAADLDRGVKEMLRERIDVWRGQEERRVAAAFRDATARFVEATNRLVERTVALCGELLQIELTVAAAPAGIDPDTRFTYSFFDVPSILASLFPDVRGYLPKGMARRMLEKELRRDVPVLVDKHCGRLRWDFVQRLDRSLLALERSLDRRLDSTIDSLRAGILRALEERTRSADRAAGGRRLLEEVRDRLSAMEMVLDRLLSETGSEEGEAA
ncbi:MAG TPA: dynamin family protein [Actinomycetota bacterium]